MADVVRGVPWLAMELDEDNVVDERSILEAGELTASLPPPAMIGKAASWNLSEEVSQQPGLGGFWSLASGRLASQQ